MEATVEKVTALEAARRSDGRSTRTAAPVHIPGCVSEEGQVSQAAGGSPTHRSHCAQEAALPQQVDPSSGFPFVRLPLCSLGKDVAKQGMKSSIVHY